MTGIRIRQVCDNKRKMSSRTQRDLTWPVTELIQKLSIQFNNTAQTINIFLINYMYIYVMLLIFLIGNQK